MSRWLLTSSCILLLLGVTTLHAGMPAPLPTEIEPVLRLKETPRLRVEVISFFLASLLFIAAAVRGLWNYLQQDFPGLPRLSYGKALAGVVLWGLLFIVVLTMISGARELMTPGAWKKQGYTYRLSADATSTPDPDVSPSELRKEHFERLQITLWKFAARNEGRYPASEEESGFGPETWQVPESGGLNYSYVGGQRTGDSTAILVYEPKLGVEERWALRINGDVVSMKSEELDAELKSEASP